MNILSIDVTSASCSIAVMLGDELVCKENKQFSRGGAVRYILPFIDDALAKADTSLDDMESFVFAHGTGSFTGSRIACAVAQGIAFVKDIALYPVNRLNAVAWMYVQKDSSFSGALLVLEQISRDRFTWLVQQWERGVCLTTSETFNIVTLSGPEQIEAFLDRFKPLVAIVPEPLLDAQNIDGAQRVNFLPFESSASVLALYVRDNKHDISAVSIEQAVPVYPVESVLIG